MNRLTHLLGQRDLLEKKIEHAAQRHYPRGCHVRWMHGQHTRQGEVIRHGYGTQIQIRTYRGADVWIDATRFV